jgi:hypothetical protein
LESMLERVWWCKRSKMKSWSQTICCPMNCSNEKKMCKLGVVGDHMPPWSVARKGRCYCQLVLKLQVGRDVDQS